MTYAYATVGVADHPLAIVSATLATGVSAEELVVQPDGTSKDVVESENGSYIVVLDDDPVVALVGQDGLDTPRADALAADLAEAQDEVLESVGADAPTRRSTPTRAR